MQRRVATILAIGFVSVGSGFAQSRLPPKGLVPDQVLVHVRIDTPEELLRSDPDGLEWLLEAMANFVGLPAVGGLDPDRPWFLFALAPNGAVGPWIVVPIAERTAFDASVVGMPEGVGVNVDGSHALLGPRPFPAGGGELPASRSDAAVELRVQTGAVYSRYAEALETSAVLEELARERSEAPDEEYKPPFDWSEVRERVLSQHHNAVSLLEQTQLAVLTLEPDTRSMQFQLEVVFDPKSELGKLVAVQEPVRPSELDALSEQVFVHVWSHVRLSKNPAALEFLIEPLSTALGFSPDHVRQLVLADSESLTGVVASHGRTLTESVYQPKSRSVADFRRLGQEAHANAPAINEMGIRRVYETEIARTHEMPVDRLVEYVGVAAVDAVGPASTSYFAFGEDKVYSTSVVGDASDAFASLSSLVGRSPGGIPAELREGLDTAPRNLVFLSWFDVAAWDRAQVGELLPPMKADGEVSAFVVHGTTEGSVLRVGGSFDVPQLTAMGARQGEIQETATAFFDEGQKSLYGHGVPKDPVRARGSYENASALGHQEATYALGYIYASGLGVPQDYQRALNWYARAGANGSSKALLEAGHILYYGRGHEVDYETAFSLYQNAAMMGDAHGQYAVAVMFENGNGVEQDLNAAREWYGLAAEQGNASAQRKLGRIHNWGIGDAEKNFDLAQRWYRAAADQGDAAAMRELGDLFSTYGFGLGGETVDLPQSAEWYRKAADAGDAEAKYELASAYYFGRGVERDDARAFELYRDGLDEMPTKHRGAVLYRLARAYQFGKSVEKDLTEAARLMVASAEEGYVFGMAAIGAFYFHGFGVETNHQEAVKWLLRSAEEEPESALLLGFAYESGQGTEQNLDEAFAWYRKAADGGHAPSQWTLANRYEHGVGVDQDWGEAAQWYRRAADQGYSVAQYGIGRLLMMGNGLEQDLFESYIWLSLAEQGATDANLREEMRTLRDSVAARLSPDELERAGRRVASFSPQREPQR